ncbi:uncharacterized protein [Ptychodera flava]|uniref:uncharacterized protein n=1 Tax=Ptychodera flava TaxID=63121 RepID=UPI00396A7089
METLKIYVILGMALALTGRLVWSLTCYECMDMNGQTNACQTQFYEHEDFVVPCDDSYNPDARCIVARVEYSDGEIAIFKRGCANSTQCSSWNRVNKETSLELFAASECCDTNLCNVGDGGQMLLPWIEATVLLPMAIVFWSVRILAS